MVLRRLLLSYDAALIRRPLLTKWASTFTIFSFCEFNAQLWTSDVAKKPDSTWRERFDAVRVRQVFGFGCIAFYNAPAMHCFYKVALSRGWPLLGRIAANTLVMDPLNILMTIFWSGMTKALDAGKTAQQSVLCSLVSIQETFPEVCAQALCVWPFWHLVVWKMMKQRYRVLGFNTGSFLWNTFLTQKLWWNESNAGLLEHAHVDIAAVASTGGARPTQEVEVPAGTAQLRV